MIRKLLLVTLIILTNTCYSQFLTKGCGWEFRSKNNISFHSITKKRTWNRGNIELYYNETCERSLKICYIKGSKQESYHFQDIGLIEYYIPVNESPVTADRIVNGVGYNTYKLREHTTKEPITLQIIYSNPPVIKVQYQNDYIEFYE